MGDPELAYELGKQSAHALVYRMAMDAAEDGITLREALLAKPQIVAQLGVAGIESLFGVGQSAGAAPR
jgi:adenylosuccinate lyase